MRVLVLLCCGAAVSAAVTEPRVLLKLSPLIGGPKLLRVHSQLFVDSGAGIDGWDFVPKDATAPATLARLVMLRAAPGDARRLVANCVEINQCVGWLEQVSRRWRGGRRGDSGRTCHKI